MSIRLSDGSVFPFLTGCSIILALGSRPTGIPSISKISQAELSKPKLTNSHFRPEWESSSKQLDIQAAQKRCAFSIAVAMDVATLSCSFDFSVFSSCLGAFIY